MLEEKTREVNLVVQEADSISFIYKEEVEEEDVTTLVPGNSVLLLVEKIQGIFNFF